MAAATQIGVVFKLGFNSAEYTGMQIEDWTDTPDADEEIVKDNDNATSTVITYDERKTASASFLIKGTGSIDAPKKNSIISIKGPNDALATKYRVSTAGTAFSRGVTKLSLSIIREVSMGAVYDV